MGLRCSWRRIGIWTSSLAHPRDVESCRRTAEEAV